MIKLVTRLDIKQLAIFVIKISVAFGLLWFMMRSGRLQWVQIKEVFSQKEMVVINFVAWFSGALILSGLRWRLLLGGVGIFTPIKRVLQLQHVGLFFNSTMPGAVGGDIIKAFYIIREQNQGQKTSALLTILLDRIVGMFGLFTLAFFGTLVSLSTVWQSKVLGPLALFIAFVFSAAAFLVIWVLFPFNPQKDPLAQLLSRKIPGFALLEKIYSALCLYRSKPLILMRAIGLSVLIQFLTLLFFWMISQSIVGASLPLGTFIVVVPVGILVTALPIAPGGLGVGHAAFERLFEAVGAGGGANVFNVYFVGHMILHLSGLLSYILLKSKVPLTELEPA